MTDKITCQICGAQVHAIQHHLAEHAADGWTMEKYQEEWPEAPIISETVRNVLLQKRLAAEKATEERPLETDDVRKPLHEVFDFGTAPAAMTASGEPIMILVRGQHDFQDMVPPVDPNYVHDINLVKTILMGLETHMPVYLWGHSGTGKTTALEQVCALTNRPMLRVQHTLNTEEAHILGMQMVKGGETGFAPGPLALAMHYGWTYMADEYDFGVPHVLSVYQPVLEGKSLVIKDAEKEWRVTKPHPHFNFVATGNTNGVGDETGLYQGTNMQNAANYERFAIVEEVGYVAPEVEELLLQSQAKLHPKDAAILVKFAIAIRKAVQNSEITAPISPRALINAGKIGAMRADFMRGLELAYINRLSAVDREVAKQIAQRIMG